MASHPIAFAAGSLARGRSVLAAVEAGFRARREPSPAVRETFLDTFDWRIHEHDGTLSATEERGGTLLCRRAADGTLRHRLLAATSPAFVDDLEASPLRDELTPIVRPRRLLPVLRLESRRIVLRLGDDREKTVGRLVLEHGTVADPERRGSRRRLPPTLEIVPVRGYESCVARLSRFLQFDQRLVPVEPCRFIRALARTGRTPGGRGSKLCAKLDPHEAAAPALKRVLRALHEIMRLNEDGVRRDLDVEFLHDFRVAVRRTRSALGQVKHVFPVADLKRFRAEFDWLGQATNELRDLDVHLLGLQDEHVELPALAEALRRQRESERRRLIADLDSERYTALARDWDRFLATPAEDAPAEQVRNVRRPIREIAVERIRRAQRRVIERGRSIEVGSPREELHRLRIDCKKLRYLIEFFASVLDETAVNKLVKALKRLQDRLGALNDLAVQRGTLQRIAQETRGAGSCGEGDAVAIEARISQLDIREHEERERFATAFREFDSERTGHWLARATGGVEGGPP